MENDEKKILSPPYLSWKTFSAYIQSLYQALPPIIDKSAMRSLSGSNQNLMMNALSYLKLIDDENKPLPLLIMLVNASPIEKQNERQTALQEIIKSAYPFLFDGSASFDLEMSTSAQFDEKFRAAGVSGETVQKCEAFFIFAAQEAGIIISKHILNARKRGPKRNIGQKPKGQKVGKGQDQGEYIPPPSIGGSGDSPPNILPKWYENFRAVFEKLPDASKNPHWTKIEREKWIVALSALLDLYINVDDEL